MNKIDTVFGAFEVCWRDGRLYMLRFPDEELGVCYCRGEIPREQQRLLTAWLQDYCRGIKAVFPEGIVIDYSEYSAFALKVLARVSAIPRGEVKTYCQIAGEIDAPKAARAVGNAIGSNRVPVVIPCHRVIRRDGAIGGFTGGAHWKERLLDLECD